MYTHTYTCSDTTTLLNVHCETNLEQCFSAYITLRPALSALCGKLLEIEDLDSQKLWLLGSVICVLTSFLGGYKQAKV